jgi:hypothetical protein
LCTGPGRILVRTVLLVQVEIDVQLYSCASALLDLVALVLRTEIVPVLPYRVVATAVDLTRSSYGSTINQL